MVKGLANAHGASIVGAAQIGPFLSVDGLWRRAGVPSASFAQLAEADAFRPALGFARREALWAIKALRNEPSLSFQPSLTRTSMRWTSTNHGRAPPGERGQRGKIPPHRDGRQRVIAVQGRIQRQGEG